MERNMFQRMPFMLSAVMLLLTVYIYLAGLNAVDPVHHHRADTHRKESTDIWPSLVCNWHFQQYVPSALELHWTKNILSLQDSVCLHSNQDDPVSMAQWVQEAHQSSISRLKVLPKSVFSHFVYQNNCTGETSVDYIEPLAGILRHPYFCLMGSQYVVDKDYLVLSWNVSSRQSAKTKAYLFDMGASLYDDGAGGASQSWLISQFERMGLHWNGVFAYESHVYEPSDVFSRIPKHIKPLYHWYNIPVSAELQHADNVWEHIKAVALPEDYVVVKLDIDNTPLEEELVRQLLLNNAKDNTLLHLVDEFFFEHHVHTRPMNGYWGTHQSPRRLADTYALFVKLRSHGVKAHVWI